MDTNKMREQFEAWAAKNYIVPPGVGHLFVRAELGDGYRLSNINHAWLGWQASREAVVVELPEQRSVPDRDCWARTNGLGFNNALKEARQVIEAQGLKVEVKP